jgi:lipoprotein-anchoring transpeptidase ErfK/SrfK
MREQRHVRLAIAMTLLLIAGAAAVAVTVATGAASASQGRESSGSLPAAVPRPEARRGVAVVEPARTSVPASQELATLLEGQEVMSRPSAHSVPVAFVAATRPLTGERTVLPVIGSSTAADGSRWLEVMVPGRPNGGTGWIRRLGTASSTTHWRIVIETARRRVVVYDDGLPVRTFVAIVGKPSTPTPLGRFFVEEVVALPPEDVGAPYALALSARSNVLQEFEGGPGQIAVHGLGNIGGVLGTAVSHGCIRLNSFEMRWLVAYITPGVPVTIVK